MVLDAHITAQVPSLLRGSGERSEPNIPHPAWRSVVRLARVEIGQKRAVGTESEFSRERTVERLQSSTTTFQMSRHLGIKLNNSP